MYVHITCTLHNHEKVPKTDWTLREKHKLYKTCLDVNLHTSVHIFSVPCIWQCVCIANEMLCCYAEIKYIFLYHNHWLYHTFLWLLDADWYRYVTAKMLLIEFPPSICLLPKFWWHFGATRTTTTTRTTSQILSWTVVVIFMDFHWWSFMYDPVNQSEVGSVSGIFKLEDA